MFEMLNSAIDWLTNAVDWLIGAIDWLNSPEGLAAYVGLVAFLVGLDLFLIGWFTWQRRSRIASAYRNARTGMASAFARIRTRIVSAYRSMKASSQRLGRRIKTITQTIGVVIVACVYVVFGAMVALAMPGFLWTVSLVFGLFLSLFIMPFIPGLIADLANKPNRHRPHDADEDTTTRDYKKSTYGFFTFLSPGRVKVIERGETFVRCVMAYPHRMFIGERDDNSFTPGQADYWEVVETKDPYADSHPLPYPGFKCNRLWILYSPLSIAWWAWKLHVYNITGAVFTGIPPFQGVRTYPVERFKKVLQPDGQTVLERIEDWSDHYRVADFQYPTIVPEADTKDKLSVKVFLNAIAWVSNPFETAYRTDNDWTTRFTSALASSTTQFTRFQPADDVLSAKDKKSTVEMKKYIATETGKSTRMFGIKIKEIQIADISPSKPHVKEALDDEALSKIEQRSDENRAKGKAAYIKEKAEAIKEAGKDLGIEGLQLAGYQAQVEMAQAAGEKGNLVILGSSTDPMQAAILRQLRQGAPQGAN